MILEITWRTIFASLLITVHRYLLVKYRYLSCIKIMLSHSVMKIEKDQDAWYFNLFLQIKSFIRRWWWQHCLWRHLSIHDSVTSQQVLSFFAVSFVHETFHNISQCLGHLVGSLTNRWRASNISSKIGKDFEIIIWCFLKIQFNYLYLFVFTCAMLGFSFFMWFSNVFIRFHDFSSIGKILDSDSFHVI